MPLTEKFLTTLLLGRKIRVCTVSNHVTVHVLSKDDDIVKILFKDDLEYIINRGWIKESCLSMLIRDVDKIIDMEIKFYKLTKMGREIAIEKYFKPL